ncbi:ATP-utilizing chromatin assembly and remodelling N-terminal-domain-containing protein [Fennellomyces sp. T-0311]|nr:ATP-utilizing chromatin assembly and remodelling N-terminal-domain-containing protein [Fennellomyces sp. T-0311]
MPLLKRKPFPLVPPPVYDPERKESRDRQVWVSPITAEIFTDYEIYLKRSTMYKQHIWQCELTGRSNLTYAEALSSERTEKDRVQEKLPDELQRRVLERAQFQSGRLDGVVDNVYDHFINRFDAGDLVTCRWNDGVKYNARVLRMLSENEHHDHALVPSVNGLKANGKDSEGQVNGSEARPRFLVELVDDNLAGLEEYKTVVTKDDLKRDRLVFSKNLLKKFLRENMVKESYNGAPWVVKASMAEKFGISTTLPDKLQAVKNQIDAKSRKRKLPSGTTRPRSKSNAKKALEDARKVEASLKYPMEDLDVPIYRRALSGDGPIIDMAPGQAEANQAPLNPTGGMPSCPEPSKTQTVPSECFGSFLMVWSFLSVFARPLGLYPFPLDDFENALRHNSTDIKSQLLIESNVCLLNAIINERRKFKHMTLPATTYLQTSSSSSQRGTPAPSPSRQSSYMAGDEEEDSQTPQDMNELPAAVDPPAPEVVWTSPQIYEIGHAWDAKPIPVGNDREGWEDILIGCIYDITTPDKANDVDRIFSYLVPREDTTLEERQEAYLGLSLNDKVFMLEMLIGVVNECSFIKEFMEECQEQMTELRKQKIDLSRERKRIFAERQELEKSAQESQGESTPDRILADSGDDEENINRSERTEHVPPRSESRQAVLKRKQLEREEREAKKLKMYHQQREEARARNQELKARNAARKKLDEDERHLHKKEEQVEHNMRKYSTLRIKPLGRDKFFNRYLYLDNIGGAHAHGTGRLFIQCPSDIDFTIIRERDIPESIHPNNPNTLTCGHGGGVQFVSALMRAQGLVDEADFMEERIRLMEGMSHNEAATQLPKAEWWRCYDDPEDIEKFMAWLNPKGEREHKLRREFDKQAHNLAMGMKKRMNDQINAAKPELSRRSTRSRNVAAPPPGSWLAYTNKIAK